MTITVKGPDGNTYQFPDGTPPEVMQSAMQKRYGGPQNQQPQQPPQMQAASPIQGGASLGDRVGALLGGGLKGATLGASDHVEAALSSLIPADRMVAPDGSADIRFGKYKHNLEQVRRRNEKQKDGAPKTYTGGQIGGAVLGLGKLSSAKALPSSYVKGTGLGKTTLGLGADGAAIAGTEALLNGRDAVKAAGEGGLIGAGLNVLTRGAIRGSSPVVQNIKARLNPEKMATNMLVNALKKSGQSVDDIKSKLNSAKDDGVGEFTIADALGEQGVRLASGLTRQHGQGGQRLADFLNQRQSGQSGRITNALDDSFKTGGKTAEDATNEISKTIRQTDKANFGKVPDEAVQPTSAMAFIEKNTQAVKDGIKPTKIEKKLAEYSDLIKSGGEGVGAQRLISIRQDLADAADKAFRGGKGGLGTKLKDLRSAIDEDILRVSPAYRDANAASSALRGVRGNIKSGQQAATRGRHEDIAAALRGTSPEGKKAFATGFADTNIARTQKAAEGSNAARPFTNQRFQALASELNEDGGEKLLRQISRENDMFMTRARATGGSKTADNLADQANVNPAVGLGVQLFRGDLPGAAGYIIRGAANRVTGNNQNSRDALADMLLSNSDDVLAKETARRIRSGERLTEAERKALVPLLAASTSGSQ